MIRPTWLILTVMVCCAWLMPMSMAAGGTTPQKGGSRGDQALRGSVSESLPDKLTIRWSFKTGDEIKSSPVISGNTLVTGSMDGYVYALDLNGHLLWKFNTENGIEASALIVDQTVYIGNLSGTFYALNLSDGKQQWKYVTDGQISGAANWWKSGNTTRIIVGSYDYNLHCIDAKTGKNIWKYESGNYINGAAACVDGKAIFGGCDGYLHIVDIVTGQASAKVNVSTYVPGSAPTQNELSYVGDYDGGFTCVNIDQKKIVWKYANSKNQLPFVASAAITGNRVVTGSRDKHVYCFGKSDGQLIWQFPAGEKVDASPLICRDKVLIGNMRGDVIILNLADGKRVASFELGTPIFANPAVTDQQIFVGGGDGKIYCLGK